METRKVQKSGKGIFIYLPIDWCREFKITRGSTVNLIKGTRGELILVPFKIKEEKKIFVIKMRDVSPKILDKAIVSSYIVGANEFNIQSEKIIPSKLDVQKYLVGLELSQATENSVTFTSTMKLEDVEEKIIMSIIRKIIALTEHLDTKNFEAKRRLEDDVDRSRLLLDRTMHQALTDPSYRRELELTTVGCVHIIQINRLLERISDYLALSHSDDKKLNEDLRNLMGMLFLSLSEKNQKRIESLFIATSVCMKKLERAKKKLDERDYIRLKRVVEHVEDIAEILLDDLFYNNMVQFELK
ncbi:MAG: hypothetical protein OH319_03960 [Candidatus Parvarchaeota archaeon]|nr:hypothetical protein [Candidatus Jingweiarchaeum tengchongense]MCW1298059.1 hypothetical protein [Candidatus Jingweiarchaeum tengchongense]MCW1300141.1 hypothetical protein [Candidatus Jingweiarchaeum tengchongense]MCW1310903.1 hypothetical protein [Candidatus Jingweiarchaeum tengchongense]